VHIFIAQINILTFFIKISGCISGYNIDNARLNLLDIFQQNVSFYGLHCLKSYLSAKCFA
jgi:hypothetical protein